MRARGCQRAVPGASHTFLSIQLPGALMAPFSSAQVQGAGDDSVVEGHRGYLSLHSHAAGRPGCSLWSLQGDAEGRAQGVACWAVVTAGEGGGRAAVLWFQVEIVWGAVGGDHVDHEAATSFGVS